MLGFCQPYLPRREDVTRPRRSIDRCKLGFAARYSAHMRLLTSTHIRVYALLSRRIPAMPFETRLTARDCNCLAVRQAARRVTQFYDRFLAPAALRTTQFSLLARLGRTGTMPLNAPAADEVLDRATTGR